MSKVPVKTIQSIDFGDVPDDLVDPLNDLAMDYCYSNGAYISLEMFLSYLKGRKRTEDLERLETFMKENELESSYFIDWNW